MASWLVCVGGPGLDPTSNSASRYCVTRWPGGFECGRLHSTARSRAQMGEFWRRQRQRASGAEGETAPAGQGEIFITASGTRRAWRAAPDGSPQVIRTVLSRSSAYASAGPDWPRRASARYRRRRAVADATVEAMEAMYKCDAREMAAVRREMPKHQAVESSPWEPSPWESSPACVSRRRACVLCRSSLCARAQGTTIRQQGTTPSQARRRCQTCVGPHGQSASALPLLALGGRRADPIPSRSRRAPSDE
ncbi:hypothetical protein K505DRAFT_414615 [Melanomma pulvis-pyrius CBS 109.77]|uniref:Uncharacterized protein n=1 Tax=Melanomma pulvis-pyrius CBS 109.77 TaxID=1314802 RepID=A0A6A6XNL2_9PLEO|nr:hypothetical protein K505DRAFT_414615 [Melanomma pulvis-pyrius CBS 109.77]